MALQNLIISSLNFFDTLMVGQLGETALASVSLANQIYFLNILFLVGVNTGTGIFVSQFWGKKDLPGIRRYSTVAMILSLLGGIGFMIPALCIPERLLSLFSRDLAVIKVGGSYLAYVALAYIFTAASFCLTNLLRSTESAVMPTIISLIGVITNIALNYAMIYGHWGFPRLGVIGSALGTDFARALECLLLVFFILNKRSDIAPGFTELKGLDLRFLRGYFTVVLPVIGNEIFWSFGMVSIQAIYPHISTQAAASVGITNAMERLAFVLFVGQASGGAVLVGKAIGEKRRDLAERYSSYLGRISVLVGILAGILISMTARPFLSLYEITPVVASTTLNMLSAYSVFLPFVSVTIVFFMGVFRASGDTGFCFWFDVLSIWAVQLPAGYIVAFILHQPAEWVYGVIMALEAPKLIVMFWRFRSGRWYHDLT